MHVLFPYFFAVAFFIFGFFVYIFLRIMNSSNYPVDPKTGEKLSAAEVKRNLQEMTHRVMARFKGIFDVKLKPPSPVVSERNWEPPIVVLDDLGTVQEYENGTAVIDLTHDDDVFEPVVDQNVVYIDGKKFPHIAKTLGFEVDEFEIDDSVADFKAVDGKELRKCELFTSCNKVTVGLKSSIVVFGSMANKVLAKKIIVHRGALIFNMEVRVPQDGKTKEEYRMYSDYRQECMHIRLFFDQIAGVYMTHPRDAEGAVAIAFILSTTATKQFQANFKKLGLPAAVYSDKRYQAFVFEVSYNYFESYKHMNQFLLMCNHWSLAYFPEEDRPIVGYITENDFNDLLLPAELRLHSFLNPQNYKCYQFAGLPETSVTEPEEQPPISDRSFSIPMPSHTVHFTPTDLYGLLKHGQLTDDMVDFYVWYLCYINLKCESTVTIVIPSNVYQMFIENCELNDTTVERSYQMAHNYNTIKSCYHFHNDLFNTDYIVMPVWRADHWFLVVVVNPSAAIVDKDEENVTHVIFVDCNRDSVNKDVEFLNILTFLMFRFNQLKADGKYAENAFHAEKVIKRVLKFDGPKVPNECSAVYTTMFVEEFFKNIPSKPSIPAFPKILHIGCVQEYRGVIYNAIMEMKYVLNDYEKGNDSEVQNVV